METHELRRIPATDRILRDPDVAAATHRLGSRTVKRELAAVLDQCRAGDLPVQSVVQELLRRLPEHCGGMRAVVNATGVLVHTNLGRAPLSAAAREALLATCGNVDLELDLSTGRRSRRGAPAVKALLDRVPEAEAAIVVNNGAAAIALVCYALGSDPRGAPRHAVVSRGEMVEIGDGFRIPELVTSAGVALREVGTTNRVNVGDYTNAIDEDTAFILKVHPSNFQVYGFTSSVEVSDLDQCGVPVVVDIGSGLVEPHPRLPDEPSLRQALKSGAAIVTASGDKLLGGPQCGLIVGRADLVERCRRHPMARAFRVDKLALAALTATLAGPPPPVSVGLGRDADELYRRAVLIAEAAAPYLIAQAERTSASVGGGGAPGVELPSAAVVVDARFATPLRRLARPVMGYVAHGQLRLDLIGVEPEQDSVIVEALRDVASATTP